MIYKYTLAIKDIYLLAIVLLVYGCSSFADKKTVDWEHMNYAKIICSGHDTAKTAGCKGEDIATEIARGRGKR